MAEKKTKKRKARKKLSQDENLSLLVPVDITKLGGEDDPCFGKLHDAKEDACRRCGDAEFCQIVMAQNMHKERSKVEKKGKFRDLEEKEIYDSQSPKEVKRAIRKAIREHGKLPIEVLFANIAIKFPATMTEKSVKKLFNKMLESTDKFKLSKDKNSVIWKS